MFEPPGLSNRENEPGILQPDEPAPFVGRISDRDVQIAALADGPTRYNQVARTVAGIRPKMLTQTLRTLERDGLVSRSIAPTVPVQVEYVLTGLGQELLEIVLDFKTWVEAHTDSITTARARFDSSNPDQSSALEY